MMNKDTNVKLCVFLSLLILVQGCSWMPFVGGRKKAELPAGRLTWAGEVPVLHLSGTPYQMGYQHGMLLKKEVRASVKNVTRFARSGSHVPVFGGFLAQATLDRAWNRMEPYVPRRYLEEMRGLAKGAGIPLKTLERMHALPDLTSTMCASFAASGSVTTSGRPIQIRNLDWAISSNVQKYAALLVYHPEGGRPFVNIGWLGFIGVISGINRDGLSVAEIGAESVDISLDGIPMPFLLRRVLEEAGSLEEAVDLVRWSKRTVGYNYLFAHAFTGRAAALETTRTRFADFYPGEEMISEYAEQIDGALFRSDFALDPAVRDLQLACKGRPAEPGLESPVESTAYQVRYLGQSRLLKRFMGRVNPEIAMAIAAAIAPASNIQSVVYAWPELWFANAEGYAPAATRVYRSVDLRELLLSD